MPRNDPRPQRKRKTPKKGARCGKRINFRTMKSVFQGTELKQRLTELRTPPSEKLALGQRVWVKVTSYCDWPGVIWSIDLCLKKIVPELVHSYTPGRKLISLLFVLMDFRKCFGAFLWRSKQHVLQEIQHQTHRRRL